MSFLVIAAFYLAGVHLGMGLGKYFWGCRHSVAKELK